LVISCSSSSAHHGSVKPVADIRVSVTGVVHMGGPVDISQWNPAQGNKHDAANQDSPTSFPDRGPPRIAKSCHCSCFGADGCSQTPTEWMGCRGRNHRPGVNRQDFLFAKLLNSRQNALFNRPRRGFRAGHKGAIQVSLRRRRDYRQGPRGQQNRRLDDIAKGTSLRQRSTDAGFQPPDLACKDQDEPNCGFGDDDRVPEMKDSGPCPTGHAARPIRLEPLRAARTEELLARKRPFARTRVYV